MTIKIKPRPKLNPAMVILIMPVAIVLCLLMCIVWMPGWLLLVVGLAGYAAIKRR